MTSITMLLAAAAIFVFSWAAAAPAGPKEARRPAAEQHTVTGKTEPATRPATSPAGPHPIPQDLPARTRFVTVALHDQVSLGMAAFIERVAGTLNKGDTLLLDINTFGGRLDAAVTIRDALLRLSDVGVKTVAFINPRAISAGALISYATDVIVVAPGATMGAATPVEIGATGETKSVGEKVVSYMRQEMRATAEAKERNGDIAEAMVDADVALDGLSKKGKLLTLDTRSALQWGVASFQARDRESLYQGLGYSRGKYETSEVRWTWAERVSGWLSDPVVSSLLMSIGMLALFIGLYGGGSPVPLSIGAVFLALFFFGHYVTRLAGVEDILLFLAGLALVVVELVHPGLIIPAVAGGLCILGSLLLGLVDFGKVPLAVQWESGWILTAISTLFGSFLATAVMAVVAVRLLPRSRLGQALALPAAIQGNALREESSPRQAMVGAAGTVLSDLRPAGKVLIDGERFDARAERGFVAKGSRVKVVRRQGFELVVSALKEDEPS